MPARKPATPTLEDEVADAVSVEEVEAEVEVPEAVAPVRDVADEAQSDGSDAAVKGAAALRAEANAQPVPDALADEVVQSLTPEQIRRAMARAAAALDAGERPSRTRAEMIHDVDPAWRDTEYDDDGNVVRDADGTSHLQAITGPDGSTVRYIGAEGAPGIAG